MLAARIAIPVRVYADEGAKHRHLALREIDDVRGLADEDE